MCRLYRRTYAHGETHELMNDELFFNKVAEMRDWQKKYFRNRDGIALQRAKAIEREIDAEIDRRKQLTNPDTQQQLF